MVNKVFINDHDIVECRVIGDQTVESIDIMGEKIQEGLSELKSKHQPLLILDDITKMGQVPSEGRKAVIALVKTLQYDRLVMLGNSGLLRVAVNLIARAAGRDKKLRYFTSHRSAIEWLLSGK